MRYICLILLLMCSSCTQQYADFFPHHDNGAIKPTVVLLPVKTSPGVENGVKDAVVLNNALRDLLMKRGRVFLPNQEKYPYLSRGGNLFHATKREEFPSVPSGECVVITELVVCERKPYKVLKKAEEAIIPAKATSLLTLGVRLKMVRIEDKKVEVLREELIKRDEVVLEEAFENPRVAKEEFSRAYKKLAEQIAASIERTSRIKPITKE